MSNGAEQTKWPTKGLPCAMPDLADLYPRISLNYLLNRCFCGGGPADDLAHARIVNFIRIVDAVVADYINLRVSLVEYLTTDNGRFFPIFDAISYAENCQQHAPCCVAVGSDSQGSERTKNQ